jgi:hypothetical protein
VTGVVQLQKKLTEPARLHHIVDHGVVLRLVIRAGDDGLVLRGSGDKVVTQEHHIV